MSTAALFVPHAGCDYRCSFCNQIAISGETHSLTPADVTAFCQSIPPDKFMELAFFGGSFSCIPRKTMVDLLEAALPFVQNGTFRGIRLSTRPDGLSVEILKLLQQYAVTTIEIGAQSMWDKVLLANGRYHTAQQVADSAKRVQDWGFSLGLQMMTGLYTSTPTLDMDTAHKLLELQPTGVRVYPTAVLAGSGLEKLMRQGLYAPLTLEESVPLCGGILELFDNAHIPVWRMGLHASPELASQVVGGTYHPAFRELCEGWVLYKNITEKLVTLTQDRYILDICPKSVSKICGHGQKPLAAWSSLGYNIRIRTNPAMEHWRDFTLWRGDF